MDTTMDMVEEHLSNRPEVEGMDIAGSNTYEEVDMDTSEECLSNRSEVEGMNMTGNHMVEDTTMDSMRVERAHGGVVIVKHRSDDGAETNRRTHRQQWLELLRRSNQLCMS
jgi:hypothetical protein